MRNEIIFFQNSKQNEPFAGDLLPLENLLDGASVRVRDVLLLQEANLTSPLVEFPLHYFLLYVCGFLVVLRGVRGLLGLCVSEDRGSENL